MTCRYHGEDRSDVVIPYRSVPEFHNEELHYFRDSNQKHRQCACGCGFPVFDCKKWGLPGLPSKDRAPGSHGRAKGGAKYVKSLRPKCDKNRVMATYPLTGDFRWDKRALKRLALMGKRPVHKRY